MAAIEFYAGLEADNSKTYWNDNKEIYESAVREPMIALLAELSDEFGEGKIFRPHRDIRFSADKSPYKTAIGATLSRGGYVQLSADGLAVGAGYYRIAPDQLDRYRAAVADDTSGEELTGVIAEVTADGIGLSVRETLKTVPRGYPKDHPRAELLRNKDLAAWRQWSIDGWLHTADAKDRVIEFFRDTRPLVAWLDANVGPSITTRE